MAASQPVPDQEPESMVDATESRLGDDGSVVIDTITVDPAIRGHVRSTQPVKHSSQRVARS